jgi:hypothetical protein
MAHVPAEHRGVAGRIPRRFIRNFGVRGFIHLELGWWLRVGAHQFER